MIAGAKNAQLYEDWLAYIENKETKDAFRFIVGVAAGVSAYRCHPQHKGAVRDFRFIDDREEQPFSFIVNKDSLLFYFRLPAVRVGKPSFADVSSVFPSAEKNRRGEWKVRLRCVADVQRLLPLVGMP